MQQKEYPQVYELGLGSLIGDFFQNVKDTVTGVAKAVAPIAPYVLPFTGLGVPTQLALGAGINLAAGKKPVEIAKDLALQVGIGGLRGAMMKPEGATFGQGFKQGAFGITPNIQTPADSGQVTGIRSAYDKVMESRLNPFSEASQFKANPKFTEDMGLLSQAIEEQYPIVGEGLTKDMIQENLLSRATLNKQLGIVPETVKRGIVGQFLPAGATLAGLTSLMTKPEEVAEEEYVSSFVPNEYYYADPTKYQLLDITGPQGYDPGIYLSADGGEVTGGVQNSGQRIKHSDGKVREHPKRIGEIAGAGTGTSDDIPAMLSDGEFVMTAKAVRNAGGGSRKAGAKKMYQMMKSLEKGGSLSPQSIGMA
jgi:hypothetical protein